MGNMRISLADFLFCMFVTILITPSVGIILADILIRIIVYWMLTDIVIYIKSRRLW